jgi:hypothetical protein
LKTLRVRHRRRDRPPQADLQSFVAARADLATRKRHDSQVDVSAIDCRHLAIYLRGIASSGNGGGTGMPESQSFLERTFGLSKNGTNVRTEFIAGLTTFLTMVYIVFVNPTILGNAGMDKGAVFVATCIAAAVSTLLMAFYANYPIALAPGIGAQCFFRIHGRTDL